MDKKEARQAVVNLLNNHCDRCEKVQGIHAYEQIHFCRDNCPVYKELRYYGDLLDDEKKREKPVPKEPRKRGNWSADEEAYILGHVRIHGIEHVADKLNRSDAAVYNKYTRLKLTSHSAK